MRRSQFDVGAQPIRNLIKNPGTEDVQNSFGTVIRSNFLLNPACKQAHTTKSVFRTNLATNPSMEHTSGSTNVVRSNRIINPGAERSEGTWIIRTNFVSHPRGKGTFAPYANAPVTQTPSVPVNSNPDGISTALRVTYTTGSNPGISILSSAVPGTTYTISAWVHHESTMSSPGQPGFAQAGVTSSGHDFRVGQWQRVSWTYTPSTSTNLIGYRIGGQSGEGTGSFLITGIMVEKSSSMNPFFDRESVNVGDFSYTLGADGWHHQTVKMPANIGANTGASRVWQSEEVTFHGTKSVRCESVSATGTGNGLNIKLSDLPLGTYTFSAHVYIPTSYGTTLTAAARGSGEETLIRSGGTSASGVWRRLSVTFPVLSTGETLLYLISSSTVPVGSVFFADAIMLEKDSVMRPYFDADNPQRNLVSNPTFATNTYGWGIAGSGSPVFSRDTSVSFFGPASAKVETNGTAPHQGIFQNNRQAAKPNRDYVASVWVKGEPGKKILLQFQEYTSTGTEIGDRSQVYFTLPDSNWNHVSVSRTLTTNAASTAVFIRTPESVAHTFWVGGVLVEEGLHQSEFFEGTGDFTYTWAGQANQSVSEQRGDAVTGITDAFTVSHRTKYMSMNGSHSLRVYGSGVAQQVFSGPTVTGLTIGANYTVSAYVYLMSDSVNVELQVSGIPSAASGVTTTKGQWVQIYQTFTATSKDHLIRFRSRHDGVLHLFVDALCLEAGSMLQPYFDGSTPNDNGLIYEWTSTVGHTSASTVSGLPVVGQQAQRSATNPDSRFWGWQAFDNGQPVARWVSPAGTPTSTWRVAGLGYRALDFGKIREGSKYTIMFKYRASGWNIGDAGVQISNASSGNTVINNTSSTRLSLSAPEWTTYRRVFTALRNADTDSFLYISLPAVPATLTDGIFEVKDAGIYDGDYTGEYFDGSSPTTDSDFIYSWAFDPNNSISNLLGKGVIGQSQVLSHGAAVASDAWRETGKSSIRVIAQDSSNQDSFVNILDTVDQSLLKPNTTYTLAGTRYQKAPLTGSISTSSFRVHLGGAELQVNNHRFVNRAGMQRIVANFTTKDTVEGPYSFIRLYNGSRAGNGDVWWDSLGLFEGITDGQHIEGGMFEAIWEGEPHKSTSVGYPQTLETIAGKPLFKSTETGTFPLNPADIAENAPRTFYSVVVAEDIPTNVVDGIFTYGKEGFGDGAGANKTLTMRLQSSAGAINNVLTRRTTGSGALSNGIPTPGACIIVGGLNEEGLLFASWYGSDRISYDNFPMSIPHESIRIEGHNQYHTHIATYMFAGVHSMDRQKEIMRMLAVTHDVTHLIQ